MTLRTPSSKSFMGSNEDTASSDYLLRVQLPNDMTTVIQVQNDMTMWEVLCVISSKKQLTPSQHIAKVVMIDGKEELADEARALSSYTQLERIVLQRRSGAASEANNPARMRQGRRASIVLNAPKPAAIRMSSQEFPKTVIDEATLAARMGRQDSGVGRKGKSIRNVAMAMLFFHKKSNAEIDTPNLGASETMRRSVAGNGQNASTASLQITQDDDRASVASRSYRRQSTSSRIDSSHGAVSTHSSSPSASDFELDTLRSFEGISHSNKKPSSAETKNLPSLPSQSPIQSFNMALTRRSSDENINSNTLPIRRSITSASFKRASVSTDVLAVDSSSSIGQKSLDVKNNSAGTIDDKPYPYSMENSLPRQESDLFKETLQREKIRKRTISTPVTSLSGSHSTSTLRRPVIRTNRQRSNTDVLTGIETAIEVTDTASATSSIPSSSTPTSVSPIGVDDTRRVVLKVALPDLASTSIMIQPELSMETVLLNICQKRKLDFDEYSLEVTKPGLVIEMDRPLGYYMNDCGISEVKVVKKEKTYSTMCVSEGGQDVMILQVIGKASKKMQVMAATPEKLIERLTDEAEQDNNFTDTILLTYRSFMSPLEFFDQLVARFNAELPPDPTPEDVEFFTKMKVPTQRRVIAAFKWWVEHHYHDFGVDGSIKADLEDFVDQIKAYNNGEFKSDALELYHLTETQNQSYEEIILNYKAVERRGKTIEGMVQEIKVEDLSQQLCIHNFKLFHNIHPIEYLNQIWKKSSESSPSMIYFIERFDKESYWAATEILREKDLKKRSSLLRKFILTAKMCADLSNFFSMFALIASLNMPVIQRLKKTWEALPEKAKKTWTELERIADPSRNMKAYRDLILAASPPIVPFLPIYLKDLIFMNDGNESRIGPDKQMINFDKLRMMANRVKDISALGSIEYSFEPKPAIQNFLAKPPIEKSMTKLKEWSLECEK